MPIIVQVGNVCPSYRQVPFSGLKSVNSSWVYTPYMVGVSLFRMLLSCTWFNTDEPADIHFGLYMNQRWLYLIMDIYCQRLERAGDTCLGYWCFRFYFLGLLF